MIAAMSLCVLLASVVGGAGEPGKPVMLRLEAEVESAGFIGWVEILGVDVADWMGRDRKGGKVSVRVTGDPLKIYRGWRHLARELELVPAGYGPHGLTEALEGFLRRGRRVLMVVDKQVRTVRFFGTDEVVAKEAGIRFQGACDHNAFMIYGDAAVFGSVGGAVDTAGGNRDYLLPQSVFDRVTKARQCVRLFGEFLVRAEETEREVEELVQKLGGASFEERERTQKRLIELGVLCVEKIRAARKVAVEPELRLRLDSVLRDVAWASMALEDLKARGELRVDDRARLLVRAMPLLSDPAKARAVESLRRLMGGEAAAGGKTSSNDELVAAWAQRLGLSAK